MRVFLLFYYCFLLRSIYSSLCAPIGLKQYPWVPSKVKAVHLLITSWESTGSRLKPLSSFDREALVSEHADET